MARCLRVLLAVLALALPALPTPAPAGAQTGFSPEVEQQLDEIAEYITGDPWQVPGGIVGVSVGNDSYVATSGVTEYQGSTPLTPDTHFRIGSVTKTFTATVVLQLVERCELSLDDTIDRWQPHLPGATEITVRNLLNMTSGIPDYVGTDTFQHVLATDPLRDWQPQQLVDLVRHDPLLFPPGTDWSYSNTNYIILGMIAEEITGQSIESLVEERIIEPLELADTSFPTTTAMPEPGTTGVQMEFDASWNLLDLQNDPIISPSATWAAGAMISTVDDLHVWARALADGTLLSPQVQAARRQVVGAGFSLTPPAGEPGPTLDVRYGLGLFEAGGMIGHNGEVPGYESIVVHDPQTDTTVVVLMNASLYVDEPEFGLEPAELPDFAMPWALGVLGQDSPYQAVPDPGAISCPGPPFTEQPTPPPAPAATAVPAAARFTG